MVIKSGPVVSVCNATLATAETVLAEVSSSRFCIELMTVEARTKTAAIKIVGFIVSTRILYGKLTLRKIVGTISSLCCAQAEGRFPLVWD